MSFLRTLDDPVLNVPGERKACLNSISIIVHCLSFIGSSLLSYPPQAPSFILLDLNPLSEETADRPSKV